MSILSALRASTDRWPLGTSISVHDWLEANVSTSGATVTQETALRLSAVYGCVRLLSESVAGLPLQTFSKLGNTRKQYPADTWIKRPNAEYTRFRFWQEMMVGLLLDGNGLARIERAGKKIVAMWPLWSPSVTIDRDDNGYRRYRVGADKYLTDYEVFHVYGLTLPGQVRGLSPVGDFAAKNAVGLGMAAEEYAASLYKNGAMPLGWIEAPSVRNKEDADRLRDQWRATHQKNHHEPGVLGGDSKWHPESFNPEAVQLVESRGFQVEEICRIYGVPPHMIASIERSTSWGCVAPETDVIAADGRRLRADEVQVGDDLLAFDPESATYLGSRVLAVGRVLKPMVKVTTRRGRVIYCTEDHPFWARTATYPSKHKELVYGRPGWVEAGELMADESAVLVAMDYASGESVEQTGTELSWLAGLAIGDGYVSDRDGTFSIYAGCPEVIQRVASISMSSFGTEVYERGTATNRHLSIRRRNGAAEYIDSLGMRGCTAETKRVPAWVWCASELERSAFVAGYLDSDGTVTEDGAVVWGSVSRELLVDVQSLLARLGVQSSLRLHTAAHIREVAGRTTEAKPFYHLKVRSKTGVERLECLLRPVDPKKAARLSAAVRSGVRRAAESYEWDRVRKVEPTFMRETVAIELDGPHTHVTAGLVSHNTGIEQQGIQWVTYSLRPWLERIEQAVNPLLGRPDWLSKDAETFCKFNVEGLLRGDFKSRMEGYEVGIRTGMYTPNRCLALEDEAPYPDGDKHYMASNMYAIEDGPPPGKPSETPSPEPADQRAFLLPEAGGIK